MISQVVLVRYAGRATAIDITILSKKLVSEVACYYDEIGDQKHYHQRFIKLKDNNTILTERVGLRLSMHVTYVSPLRLANLVLTTGLIHLHYSA